MVGLACGRELFGAMLTGGHGLPGFSWFGEYGGKRLYATALFHGHHPDSEGQGRVSSKATVGLS